MRSASHRATLKRLEREGREMDLIQDPTTMTQNQLATSLYRMKRYDHINNTPERTAELQARSRAIMAEQARRRQS